MSVWARPTLNLSIYEIVFSLFAKIECRIQIIKRIWTILAFLWKWFKSIRQRRENGFDTQKLHHDTLLKTFKKHWYNLYIAGLNQQLTVPNFVWKDES